MYVKACLLLWIRNLWVPEHVGVHCLEGNTADLALDVKVGQDLLDGQDVLALFLAHLWPNFVIYGQGVIIKEIVYPIASKLMKSSFKKVQKPGSSQKGHFGHPQLDAIFSNSLTKGHLIVLQQDHPTTNYLSLLRYFISSNYHESIPSLIYDSNCNKWKHLISPVKKMEQNGRGGELEKPVGQKSEIAWRYDSMDINLSELVLSQQIKFLDLTKQVQNVKEDLIVAKEYPNCSVEDFYRQIEQDYLGCQQDEKDTRHKKILLASMPSTFYKDQNINIFLHALRCMTRSSHVTTLISLPPIISQQVRATFLMYSDIYLQIGKIGKGYTDFCASLSILKEVQSGQIKTKNRGCTIWGIKNKKKDFRIQSLYEQAIQESIADETKSGKESVQF